MKQIPKYRLHKASGQAAVVLSGVWHYLGVFDSPESHELYRRKVAEWLTSGAGRPVEPHPEVTVSTVVDAYLSHVRPLVCPTQFHRVKTALLAAHRLYGPTRAADFGGRALKAVRLALANGRVRSQVNLLVGCLKRCWKWALSEELVPAAAVQSVLAVAGLRKGEPAAPGAEPPAEGEPVSPVPEADVEATLPHLSPTLADMVRVQMYAGMRPGEVCRLRADEIAQEAPDLWVWRPAEHKTAHHGHGRQVFIGPRAIAVIQGRLDAAAGGYLFSPARARLERFAAMRAARKSRVQPSQVDRSKAGPKKAPGERYRRDSYAQSIARACASAGVPRWHPHQLRHLAATKAVAEFGWDHARILLGHRHIDTTRIYAEDDISKVADMVRKVG